MVPLVLWLLIFHGILEMGRDKSAVFFFPVFRAFQKKFYESADLDGVNTWQKFRYITVPMLRPITTYVLTISIYGGLAMFTESYMLWAGNSHRMIWDLQLWDICTEQDGNRIIWDSDLPLVYFC